MVIESAKGEIMKIRFTRDCEYLIQKRELFGGDETTSFDSGEEYEVEAVEKSSYDSEASNITFKKPRDWKGFCINTQDFEIVEDL
jgi:hypothetical protein